MHYPETPKLGTRWPGLPLQTAFLRRFKTTRANFMACVAPGGINKTVWGAKLILTVDLAFAVSCASLGHLLMARHCHLCLSACFSPPTAPHLPPLPTPPPSRPPTPIDSIHDITVI